MNISKISAGLLLSAITLATMACSSEMPPTRLSTPMPGPTETSTQLPPVSVNSDCIGCNVAMPREVATPLLALRDYGAPDKILLVTCSRGYSAGGHLVMGPLRRTGYSEIVVQGLQHENANEGDCFAITATYVGTEVYCRADSAYSDCRFGPDESILTFKVAGEFTQLTHSQYHAMKQYAVIAR